MPIRGIRRLCAVLSLLFVLGCAESGGNARLGQAYSLERLLPKEAPVAAAPALKSVQIERGSQAIISSVRVVVEMSETRAYDVQSHTGLCRVRITGIEQGPVASRIQSGWAKASEIVVQQVGEDIVLSMRADPSVTCRGFHLAAPSRILIDLDAPATKPDRPIVVLDPGHGGDDFGARADHLHESDLVLDIARRVGGILERANPELLVLQTRTDDRFIALERRVAFANAVGAVAFISIHLNSADEKVRRGGVSTFVLDTSGSSQARKLAAHENGTSLDGVSELQTLLASLHRKEQVSESKKLAEFIQKGVLVGAQQTLPRIYDRGVRKALFAVLVGAKMPAVLVEGSFLTQPEEAAALARDAYRQDIARGIASGILRYMSRP